jgi:cell division protein FtsW (lipid II flippase)
MPRNPALPFYCGWRIANAAAIRDSRRQEIWRKAMRGDGSREPGSRLWYLLLLIPYVAMIWVSSYNKAEPSLGGVPFFYWYQLLWILIGSALIVIVHLAVNRHRR